VVLSVSHAVSTTTAKMKNQTKNSYSMTLRLPPAVATELENAANDLTLSKSGFIRRADLRALIHLKEHELPQPADTTLRRGRQK
jgi:hypothetical protein